VKIAKRGRKRYPSQAPAAGTDPIEAWEAERKRQKVETSMA
jgi:hypothetical protein